MNHQEKKPLPIAPQQRIQELDILRGIALLGILIVNMSFFASSVMYIDWTDQWTSTQDKLAYSLMTIFVEFKFVTMFSFLFGIGFLVFMERIEEKGLSPKKYFIRRLFFLLAVGLFHMVLLWYGDILTVYALLGFLLLIFYKRKQKTLLVSAFILLLLPCFMLLFIALGMFATPEDLRLEWLVEFQQQAEQADAAYAKGTFTEILEQRLVDISMILQGSMTMLFSILGMFLLGLYTWRRGIFQQIDEHITFIKKVWIRTLILGVLISGITLYFGTLAEDRLSPYYYLEYTFITLGGPVICFFYISSLFLLTRKKAWITRLKPLQAVGRMPLSNYLLQTLVCTTIFYGYGFGLYGQIGPAVGLALAFIIFIAQIAISHYWLKKFSYGPMEWLWRRWTYWKKLY